MTETEIVEFKKSFAELKAGLVSIAAILNKHGAGELWFGVRNDGKVVGLDASDKSLRDLSQAIAAHIEPRIYPRVEIEIRDGANCVKVSFSGKDAPYFAYGRAYMRVADEDRQLSAKELENLILSKNRDLLCWDREVSSVTLDDLDEGRLKRFVERAGLAWDVPSNVLAKLGLLKDGCSMPRCFFSLKLPSSNYAAPCLAASAAPALSTATTLTATFSNSSRKHRNIS